MPRVETRSFPDVPLAIAAAFFYCLGLFAHAQAPAGTPPHAASPSRVAVGLDAQKEVSVTLYNNGYGLIREVREPNLPQGATELEYQDVAERIDPTSVAFKALGEGGEVAILEQNYRYDLLTPAALLSRFVGREIGFTEWRRDSRAQGSEIAQSRKGTLLSVNEGTIVRFGDSIEINPGGTVRVEKVPSDLLSRPTLLWLLNNAGTAGKRAIETSYLTEGFSWKADYVAVISADDSKLDLTGWVTLDNRTGATYRDAKLKLVAGDVQRVAQPEAKLAMQAMRANAADASLQGGFEEQAFFEYHLYSLGRTTTLANNETKQMTLLEGSDVPVKKTYVVQSAPVGFRGGAGWQDRRNASVMLEFENKESGGLGMPLPQGRVRVYKADDDGSLQLAGEDAVPHTPREEAVRLKMGEAFDVVAEMSQTELKKISERASQLSFRAEIRNRKEEAVEVKVLEAMRGEWEVKEASHPWIKRDQGTLEFTVPAEKDVPATLTYTVEVRW